MFKIIEGFSPMGNNNTTTAVSFEAPSGIRYYITSFRVKGDAQNCVDALNEVLDTYIESEALRG